MSPEKEEILTDPVNHAVLKKMAREEELSIKELSEKIGVKEERVKHRTSKLDSRNFLERKANNLHFKDEHREHIESLKNSIEDFSEEHSENISESHGQHQEKLGEIREELERQKKETDLVTKEKEIDRKLELLEESMNSEESGLEELSKSSRIRGLLDESTDFHGFHPFRKQKAKKKAEEVLENSPEEKDERRFFGNRWVSNKSLSN